MSAKFSGLTRAFHTNKHRLNHNAPSILFVGGLAGMLWGTFAACKAARKREPVVDELEHDLEQIDHHGWRTLSNTAKKDTVYVYGKAAKHIARLYAPAVIVDTVSIMALTKSHTTLTARNTALLTSLATVTKAFEDYRKEVSDRHGEEEDRDIALDAEDRTIAKKKAEIKVGDPNRRSMYARFFDAGSEHWANNAELNKLFLLAQQNYANNLLIARGHLFLNEVYDMLGLDRSCPGAVVGWVVGKEGDNYVDFGIFDVMSNGLVNGYEPRILLDFNVDGVIYDKIGKERT